MDQPRLRPNPNSKDNKTNHLVENRPPRPNHLLLPVTSADMLCYHHLFTPSSYIEAIELMAVDAHSAWRSLEAAGMDMNTLLHATANVLGVEIVVHSQADLSVSWATHNRGGGATVRIFQQGGDHFLGTVHPPAPAPAPAPLPPRRSSGRNITRENYRDMIRGTAGQGAPTAGKCTSGLLSMPDCAWVSLQLYLCCARREWILFTFDSLLQCTSKLIRGLCQASSPKNVLRYELTHIPLDKEGEIASWFVRL